MSYNQSSQSSVISISDMAPEALIAVEKMTAAQQSKYLQFKNNQKRAEELFLQQLLSNNQDNDDSEERFRYF
ncbi:hypothetical protein HDU99_001245 [Rhizoclosmatium hyalinum]|nr:hypothetical protein HDU99_001245 [Rhizoclosmatium hyalinum]